MNIQNKILFVMMLFIPALANCEKKSQMKFSVKVVDQEGDSVTECDAKAIIFDASKKRSKRYSPTTQMVNENGVAYFDLSSASGWMSYGVTAPAGYYTSYGKEFSFIESEKGVWKPEGKEFKIVLKRIKTPIAMYVKKRAWICAC